MATNALIMAALLTCGIYDVSLHDEKISVNGAVYGAYQEAEMDKYFNVHYLFSHGSRTSIIRETPKGRFAFKVVGESVWQSCEKGGKRKTKGGGGF